MRPGFETSEDQGTASAPLRHVSRSLVVWGLRNARRRGCDRVPGLFVRARWVRTGVFAGPVPV